MKKKKKTETDSFEKLLNLTKMIQGEKVKIEPKGFPRSPNKWRTQDPKFAPKEPTAQERTDLVDAGGMKVDPSLKEAYENWRKDKIAEQNERRAQSIRKAEAARKARQLRRDAF